MKRDAIERLLKADPAVVFAVKLGPHIVATTLRFNDLRPALPSPVPLLPLLLPEGRRVSLAAVLSTWKDYDYKRALSEAYVMDDTWETMREYEASRAAFAARAALALPAFKGIMVHAGHSQGLSAPRVSLVNELEHMFVESRSGTYSARFDVFEAIAERIIALEAALGLAGWSDEGVDTGVPVVNQLPPRPPKRIEQIEAELEKLG